LFFYTNLLFILAGGPTKEEDLPEPSPPEPFEYRDE
jgi:hypothetical protein